jgi:hypothetical protein
MKILLPLFISITFLSACSGKPETTNTKESQDTVRNAQPVNNVVEPSSVKLTELFTLADAESILGEPAHVTDSTMGSQQGISAYKSSYTANAGGAKAGTIYFLAEEYSKVPDAQTKYGFIKAANENSGGFKALEGIGDEAYFHSDNEKFYFIMARKGKRVVTFKVNKITPKTSLDNFNRVAREVVAKM